MGPFLDLHLRPYMDQVWDPKWSSKWTDLGPQIDLQMDEIWNPKCIPNVSHMYLKWNPNGHEIGPQMDPNWITKTASEASSAGVQNHFNIN